MGVTSHPSHPPRCAPVLAGRSTGSSGHICMVATVQRRLRFTRKVMTSYQARFWAKICGEGAWPLAFPPFPSPLPPSSSLPFPFPSPPLGQLSLSSFLGR